LIAINAGVGQTDESGALNEGVLMTIRAMSYRFLTPAHAARIGLGMLLATVSFPLAAGVQSSPDEAEGKKVTEFLCKNCHDVSGNERPKNPPGGAPAFFDLAQSPDTTAGSLRKFLALPHGRMINVLLTGKERENVIAYIMSVKRK
jgi:cytochrome c2